MPTVAAVGSSSGSANSGSEAQIEEPRGKLGELPYPRVSYGRTARFGTPAVGAQILPACGASGLSGRKAGPCQNARTIRPGERRRRKQFPTQSRTIRTRAERRRRNAESTTLAMEHEAHGAPGFELGSRVMPSNGPAMWVGPEHAANASRPHTPGIPVAHTGSRSIRSGPAPLRGPQSLRDVSVRRQRGRRRDRRRW